MMGMLDRLQLRAHERRLLVGGGVVLFLMLNLWFVWPHYGDLARVRAQIRAHQATLTDREQQVLSLIAAGHPTREVAQQLCYSERTVKNVLHDVVTKLNARSRSQAVAFAVREGLI